MAVRQGADISVFRHQSLFTNSRIKLTTIVGTPYKNAIDGMIVTARRPASGKDGDDSQAPGRSRCVRTMKIMLSRTKKTYQ